MAKFIDDLKLKGEEVKSSWNASCIAWITFLVGLGGLIGGALTKSVLGAYIQVIVNTLRVTERMIELIHLVDLSNQAEKSLLFYQNECFGLIAISITVMMGALVTLVCISRNNFKMVKLNLVINILIICIVVGLSANVFHQHSKLHINLAKDFRTSMLSTFKTSHEYEYEPGQSELPLMPQSEYHKFSHNFIVHRIQRVFMCCGAIDFRDYQTYKKLTPDTRKVPLSCCKDASLGDIKTCVDNPTPSNSFIGIGCHKAIYSRIESSPWILTTSIVAQIVVFTVCTFATFAILYQEQHKKDTLRATPFDEESEPLKSDFSID
ncbi:hypothetical protein Ciccas_001444 [Cichlidogyrus casuarinus]|uniref:Tetraspanin n=1 Tax=Cichlidogyrus casuarinus TaxID=1844966 RepID=A0ABD2QK36_9PLAT